MFAMCSKGPRSKEYTFYKISLPWSVAASATVDKDKSLKSSNI